MQLVVANLAKAFGAQEVFKDISFMIDKGERVGLIGVNGSGKSTLVNCLLNPDWADRGTVSFEPGLRLGHVEQGFAGIKDESIWEFMLHSCPEILQLRSRLMELEKMISAGTESVLQEYARTTQLYEHLDGYGYESRLKKVLLGLAFPEATWKHNALELSGGQKTRMMLAAALVSAPDFLILDEPISQIDPQGAKELLNVNFENSIGSWETAWASTLVTLDSGNGVALTRATGNDQVVAIYKNITGVDFTKPIQIKANIYVPMGYQGSGFYGKFFNTQTGWMPTKDMGAITYGAWNEVIFTEDFGSQNSGVGWTELGIQIGNLGVGSAADPNFYGPIIIKDLVISGVEANNSFVPGVIYNQPFNSDDEDNWASMSWGDSGVVEAANGSLNITAKNADADRIDVQQQNLAKIEGFNLQEPFTFKTRIFIPSYYQDKTTLMIQFYMQDANWLNHFNIVDLAYEDLKIGDWNDIDVKVEFPEAFNRDGLPKYMGFSFATNFEANVVGAPISQTDPIKIDEIIFEGMVPVEKEETDLGLVDFFYVDQFADLSVDFTSGVIQPVDLENAGSAFLRSAPFSWLAWSWFGNSTENAAWDMTTNPANSTSLTERGEDIINGKGGIKDYLPAEEN